MATGRAGLRRALGALMFLMAASCGVDAQVAPPTLATPVEPVTAILEAFERHALVALGEGRHGNEQGHAFRLALVRDPRFAARVNDIVVEMGNARYQDVMDRFVAGEAVSPTVLRQVWQNTTQPHDGPDRPIYEAFYRAVRAVNAALPKDRQLRVLLGDPPIDWNSPTAKQDRGKWMAMRDSFPAELVEREVLARRRRALIIYGDGHLQRQQIASNYEMSHPLAQTLVSLIERRHPRVFSIKTEAVLDLRTLQPDVARWPIPSLALTAGTVLGAADYAIYAAGAPPRVAIVDGTMVPVPREQWRVWPMERQFDAVLYLGPPSSITYSELAPALCADPGYMAMRLGRLAEAGPPGEAARLTAYCAGVRQR